MATEFIMPRVHDQPQPQFYPQPQQHYQYSSPQSQSLSQPQPQSHSHSQSPTAPAQAQSIYQTRQISPLSTSNNASPTTTSPISQQNLRLQPAYMPAVLRPNLYPSKPKKADDADQSSLQSNQSFLTLNGWGLLGKLTRRTTADSGKCLDDDDDDEDGASVQWNLDLFPKCTSQPTREHWKVSELLNSAPGPTTTHDPLPRVDRNILSVIPAWMMRTRADFKNV